MTDRKAIEEARPRECPFCAAHLRVVSGMGLYWRHPHPTDCMISGITVTPGWFDKWNSRTHAGWHEAIEAAAKVCEARAVRHAEDGTRIEATPGSGPFYNICIAAEDEANEAAMAIRALPPPGGRTEEKS